MHSTLLIPLPWHPSFENYEEMQSIINKIRKLTGGLSPTKWISILAGEYFSAYCS
jgi:hypothetical protein